MLNSSNTYKILEMDTFNPLNYPLVEKELNKLRLEIMHLPLPYRSEIVISFLKEITIKANWAQLNPELVDFMKYTIFPIQQLKYLFTSCQNNMIFLNDFEQYIISKVLNSSTIKWTAFS